VKTYLSFSRERGATQRAAPAFEYSEVLRVVTQRGGQLLEFELKSATRPTTREKKRVSEHQNKQKARKAKIK